MRPTWHLLWLAALLSSAGACARREPPRELRLELPSVITSKAPLPVQVRAIGQDGTTSRLDGKLSFQVSPPELASVDALGLLSCSRSGEGSVSLDIAGVVGRTKLSCKLASRLEGPARLSLDITAGEVEVPIQVLDAAGGELDLPLRITAEPSSVVVARAGKLVPGSVGRAKLAVRAGELTRQIEVEVVRTLTPELVGVDQNRRIYYSLDAGKYRLSLSLPKSERVSVDWTGAPYCAYRGDAAEHHIDCTLQRKGGVTFDSPAFLLRGDKVLSREGASLREVP
ncbi:MAG TPA: hypothetical protein VIW29_05890 [Polyangiaceae bacterium]